MHGGKKVEMRGSVPNVRHYVVNHVFKTSELLFIVASMIERSKSVLGTHTLLSYIMLIARSNSCLPSHAVYQSINAHGSIKTSLAYIAITCQIPSINDNLVEDIF